MRTSKRRRIAVGRRGCRMGVQREAGVVQMHQEQLVRAQVGIPHPAQAVIAVVAKAVAAAAAAVLGVTAVVAVAVAAVVQVIAGRQTLLGQNLQVDTLLVLVHS
jgi:hypothetical protein